MSVLGLMILAAAARPGAVVLLPKAFLNLAQAAGGTHAGGAASAAMQAAVDPLTQRIQWVIQHCRPVPSRLIGPDAAQAGVMFDRARQCCPAGVQPCQVRSTVIRSSLRRAGSAAESTFAHWTSEASAASTASRPPITPSGIDQS